jgi:hypothetical protein
VRGEERGVRAYVRSVDAAIAVHALGEPTGHVASARGRVGRSSDDWGDGELGLQVEADEDGGMPMPEFEFDY